MKSFSNFSWHMYTEIVFGRGVESQVGAMIRKYGGKKVMLVYGSGSIKRSGLYDRVTAELEKSDVPFVELKGVKANPLRSLAQEGLRRALDEKVDFLLGVGGASVIDTAKAIALGLANDGVFWDFYNGRPAEKMAPVGVISTIAAAGSETSRSSVLVDDLDTGCKRGFMYDPCRPVFALMNPELTYSVSPYQTAAGCADIFSHTFMRYFSNDDSYLGDGFCVNVMRTVRRYASAALKYPDDYEARAELMLAASMSHNDLTNLGRGQGMRGGEHALESQLSGHYDTTHGAGLAAMMPAMLDYAIRHGSEKQVARVAEFGVRVFDTESVMADPVGTAREGVKRFRAWLMSISMPVTLKELGVPEREYDDAAERCVRYYGVINGFLKLDGNAIREIYKSAAE